MPTPIKDKTSQRFGFLTAIKIEKKDGKSKWLCKCDCGNYCHHTGSYLEYSRKNNGFPTCGCSKINYEGKYRTIVGINTPLIKILSFDKEKNLYKCINRKGKEEYLTALNAKSRIVKSNDYVKKLNEKNDYAKKYGYEDICQYNKQSIRLHHILIMMKERCYNKSFDKYKYYGERNIKVYNKWLENPKEFVRWAMENGYKKGLQIDRINNDGDYEPSNCRWVTRLQNMNNTSRNFYIEIDGIKKSLAQWCREFNLDYKKTHSLIRYKNKTLESIIKKSGN